MFELLEGRVGVGWGGGYGYGKGRIREGRRVCVG